MVKTLKDVKKKIAVQDASWNDSPMKMPNLAKGGESTTAQC